LHSQKKKKKKGEVALNVETCKKCFATYKPTPICPVCGYQAENRERFIKQEEGELEELKRKEQEETERKQQKLLIATAKTLEELEMVAKILGYKKGWAYRVFESRKYKVPRRLANNLNKSAKFAKGKKIASDMDLNKKESIAKLACLNNSLYEYIKNINDKTEHEINMITASDEPEIAWHFTEINGAKKWFLKDRYKKDYFKMLKHRWDRLFIINYVNTVRNNRMFIDPNDFTGPIKP